MGHARLPRARPRSAAHDLGRGRADEAGRADQGQVEMSVDPRRRGADGRDRVDGVHRSPDPAPVALVSCGVRARRLEGHPGRRLALDLDRVPDRAVAPVRVEVVVHLPETAENDHLVTAGPGDPLVPHAADGPCRDLSRPHGQVTPGHRDVEVAGVLVDLDAEAVREQGHGLAEDVLHRADERAGFPAGLVRVAAEAEAVEVHRVAWVRGQVGDLLHHDLVDARAQPCDGQRQQVPGEAGMDAPAEQRRPALPARLRHRGDGRLVGLGPRIGPARRRHDALAGTQDRAHLLDVRLERRGVDAVRLDGEDVLNRRGRGDARRRDAGQRARVGPGLGLGGDVHARQLVRGIADEVPDRDPPDGPGGPLDDAVGTAFHVSHCPPLTERCWPVTAAASSEARNSTAPAHWSGVGTNPSGISVALTFSHSSTVVPAAAAAPAPSRVRFSPSTGPRYTPLTRICQRPASTASVRVSAASAAFDVEYAPMAGGVRTAAPELTRMIEPPPRPRIPGTTAWTRCRAPYRLTSKMRRHSSGSASATGCQSPSWWPFCTRMSMPPKRSPAAATSRWQASRSVMSAGTTSGSRPSARTSAATASSRSARRAARTTSTPPRARPSAMLRPMPGPTPLTTA